MDVIFNNTGTVEVQTGTLKFNRAYAQTAGGTLLNGGEIASTQTLDVQGGSLSGTGTITGDVSNGGQVSPGLSPDTLNITGDYTQTSTGNLNIEIGGFNPGTDFDQLIMTGSATLAGILTVSLINNFDPNFGDTFQIVTYGSGSGSFGTTNLPPLSGDLQWHISYRANAIILSVGVCVTVPLNEGWNLISFNVAPIDSSVDSVTAPISDHLIVVRGFDLLGLEHGQGANGGLTYDPLLPFLSSLKWMGCRYGYWVKVSQACTLVVCGNRCRCDEPVALNRGWNLVGYLPEESNQVATALDSLLGGENINSQDWTGSYRVVRGFDLNGLAHGQGSNGGLTFDPTLPALLSSLRCMMNTFGYWVKLYPDAAETTLVYPCGAGDCPSGLAKAGAVSDSTFTFIPTSRWVDFYGRAEVAGGPVRVGDVVTVYDPDGVQCGGMITHSRGWYGLVPVYGDDETTVGVYEGAKVGDRLTFYINGQRAHSTKPVWVGDGRVLQVDLAVSQLSAVCRLSSGIENRLPLPTEYGLSQNHPNPFNPSTTINYTLSSEERRAKSGERLIPVHTTLKIYNLLGQEVRTLVGGKKEPGYYMVTWDGRNERGDEVSSGIYFYRLRAGEFVDTKRMLLVK